jgi:hypothetical protein
MQRKKAGRRARVRPGILAAMIALAALTGAAAPLGGQAAAARVRPAASPVPSGSSSAGTPVPAAFKAQSITWATPRSGRPGTGSRSACRPTSPRSWP